MTFEAVLAALHLVAILAVVVFQSSQAALCRPEWMSAAIVQRLVRLDVLVAITFAAVLLTGLARLYLGIKGLGWYVSQPLFHVKMALFVLMAALLVPPALTFRRWRDLLGATGALPAEDEVRRARRWVMAAAHLLPVAAVVAVFWARGW